MKKGLLCSSLLFGAISVLAQPSIQHYEFNYATYPVFDYDYHTRQTPIDPGSSGANVTWSFGNLGPGNTVNYTTATCPEDASCGTFPAANQVVSASAGAKVFFNKTNTALEQVGEMAGGTITFSDPMKMLEFPITFNQTFSDTYLSTTVTGTKSGNITSTIDGYGTLITPKGTYQNVLRQKIVENAIVSSAGTPVQMLITHYYWMKPFTHHYLMTLLSTEVIGLPVPVPPTYVITYTTNPPVSVGVREQQLADNSVSVFPNPVKHNLIIKTDGLNIEKVDIYNILGQKVISRLFRTGNNSNVDMGDLQLGKGCYLVKIYTGKGQVAKQIVVQ